MSHPWLVQASKFGALIPGLLGVNALLRPNSALSVFSLPLPPQGEQRRTMRSVMRFYGARQVSIACLCWLVCSTGDERLMGYAALAELQVVVVDALVCRAQLGYIDWSHWASAALGLGLAGGLLGWF
ncbi:hypothetical protein BX600DRAFT_467546 [Xylariales sp. PMI_506]|nr:hypothetical protein BX600DRAFT_467546 [Xylariales sp. PMI_506]